MGIPAEREPWCILADQTFDGALGNGHGSWQAAGKWTIESGVAKYDQGVSPARLVLEQWTTSQVVGEQHTCEFDILSIDCGAGEFDGLVVEWCDSHSNYLTEVGHYSFNWLCEGLATDYFSILPPQIVGGGAKCTIDNVYLYLQTKAAFEFLAQSFLDKVGTRYEEYAVGGDFVTWYHHKLDETHIAVKYSPP